MIEPSDKSTHFLENKMLKCADNVLLLDKPLVMGILNLTPDSFYDGGRYITELDALEQTEKMIDEGASIIDLGAVSTRPGASEVTENDEIKRLIPVLHELVRRFPKTVFSVDTFRSEVAKQAACEGAGIINDISGGSFDIQMFTTVADLHLPYILMHKQGTPQNMQINPQYLDVVAEVYQYFAEKLGDLSVSGQQQIILDPGFGFGKTIDHNYQLLNQLHKFSNFNKPLLVGLSRKSMIYKLLQISPNESLPATTALNMVAVLNGASILRVHDVKEAMQAIKLATALQAVKE